MMKTVFQGDGPRPAVGDVAEAKAVADDSETEDEEVKMNCITGFRGIVDSDMNTTDHSDNESECEDPSER